MPLAKEIIHQQQPTGCSCVATCIAMALGSRVTDLGVPLSNALDPEDFGVWLAERGVWMRQGIIVDGHGETLRQGHVYLIGVRSQNIVCSDHAILADTRGEPTNSNPRSGWKFFDPVAGMEGKRAYRWADPGQIMNFCELRDRSITGHVCVGTPPSARPPDPTDPSR